MLKWFKRIALGIVALTCVLIVSGIFFEQWSRFSVARDFQPSGQLYEADGRVMHLYCSGTGEPTVVLESGLDFAGSLAWAAVQPKIATTNRVCSYDRAGILWSDGRDEPPTADQVTENLHTLLGIASEKPPYVLVGHSLGGPLSMAFADRYPNEVKGVVLVDSSHPGQIERFSAEAKEAMRGPPPAIIAKTMAATGLLRLLESGPMDGAPDETQVALKFLPQSLSGVLSEFAAIDEMFGEPFAAGSFGNLPLIVLTAGKLPDESPPGMTPELEAEVSKVWSELQVELTALSTSGEQRVIDDATHYIQYDNPDAVIQAIRDVLASSEVSTADSHE